MRDLLGQPLGVTHATARHGGVYMTASIDYGDFVCQFETGVDEIPRFDAHLEVFGASRVVRVQYDTPYVRNLPIRVTITDATEDGGVAIQATHPQWGDAFAAQWLAFHDSVVRREQPAASAADFRRDLELFTQMIGLMSPGEHEAVAR
jgi:predicted dehydrogenase